MSESLYNLITVVIPTCNRPDRLARALNYLLSFKLDFAVIVADSSSVALGCKNEQLLKDSRVCYFKYPAEEQVFRKIYNVLENVRTPYVVLWADDDLMAPFLFAKRIKFLEAHKDFSAIAGESFVFQIKKNTQKAAVSWLLAYSQRSYDSDNIQRRVLGHFHSYNPTFYSIHRTENLKNNITLCLDAGLNLFFGELFLSTLTVIQGKIKIDRDFYMLREALVDQSKSYKKRDLFDEICSADFVYQCDKFISVLASQLARHASISLDKSVQIIKLAFLKYIQGALKYSYLKRARECRVERFSVIRVFSRALAKPLFLSCALLRVCVSLSFIKYRQGYRSLYRAIRYSVE